MRATRDRRDSDEWIAERKRILANRARLGYGYWADERNKIGGGGGVPSQRTAAEQRRVDADRQARYRARVKAERETNP